MRVAAINNDVPFLKEGKQSLDPVIDGLASLDEKHDTAGLLELGDKLLCRMGTNNGLALSLVLQEAVDLGNGSIKGANCEAVIGHVQNQVLTPEVE